MGNNCCSSRNKDSRNKNYVLILGSSGSGKSTLYQKLQRDNNQVNFVDVPALDFEESIVKREQCIENFQNIYEQITKNNSIISLIVSVKFERTDIMKRNLLSVIKYFRRFIDLILIAVTNFDLSENQNDDKHHLRRSLKFLLNNREDRIIFSENSDQNDNQMREDVQKIINQNKQQRFTLEDTIFERTDITQQQYLLREFAHQFLNKQ